MRIGLISDFEGCAVSLEAALRHLRAASVDLIVHAGDILEAPISRDPPGETFEQLRARNVLAIPGNHDRWLIDLDTPRWPMTLWLRRRRHDALGDWLHMLPAGRAAIAAGDLAWLRGLPEDRVLDAPGAAGGVYVCHGMPGNTFNSMWPADPVYDANVSEDDRRAALELDGMAHAEIVLCGHVPDPLEMWAARADGAPIRVIRAGGRRSDGATFLAGCAIVTAANGRGPDRWSVDHRWIEYQPRNPSRPMRSR